MLLAYALLILSGIANCNAQHKAEYNAPSDWGETRKIFWNVHFKHGFWDLKLSNLKFKHFCEVSSFVYCHPWFFLGAFLLLGRFFTIGPFDPWRVTPWRWKLDQTTQHYFSCEKLYLKISSLLVLSFRSICADGRMRSKILQYYLLGDKPTVQIIKVNKLDITAKTKNMSSKCLPDQEAGSFKDWVAKSLRKMPGKSVYCWLRNHLILLSFQKGAGSC